MILAGGQQRLCALLGGQGARIATPKWTLRLSAAYTTSPNEVRACRRAASTQAFGSNNESTIARDWEATRLSLQFVPTLRSETLSREHLQIESLSLLLRGGYIRQSSSGHYSLLPNGLRVVKNIERIIDEEMQAIGGCRLELPTMLSSALWHKSGRMDTMGSELYKVRDRRGSEYILAPTAEEEITKLVGEEVQSWRQLPVRVYQITTKHRDEPRPRSGLLRTRSFLMKDLYTFDADVEEAQQSYNDVTIAYRRIMTRLFGDEGRGWYTAQADSGAMGGLHSHEYQVPDPLGEDTLMSCDSCGYAANSELAASLLSNDGLPVGAADVSVLLYGPSDLTEQGYSLTALVLPRDRQVNSVKVEKAISNLASPVPLTQLFPSRTDINWDWKDRPEGPMVRFDRLRVLVDHECRGLEPEDISDAVLGAIEAFGSPPGMPQAHAETRASDAPSLHDYFAQQFSAPEDSMACELIDLRQAQDGDTCAACRQGILKGENAIEVGHTFLLGERYSDTLGYKVQGKDASSPPVPLQMGCYGIGLTRIFGVLAQIASRRLSALQSSSSNAKANSAVARKKSSRVGFAWDAAVAPYRALVLPLHPSSVVQMHGAKRIIAWLNRRLDIESPENAASPALTDIKRALDSSDGRRLRSSDIALDDRSDHSTGERLAETDLIGYPVVFLLGKTFESTGHVEVRCRTPDALVTHQVPLDDFL